MLRSTPDFHLETHVLLRLLGPWGKNRPCITEILDNVTSTEEDLLIALRDEQRAWQTVQYDSYLISIIISRSLKRVSAFIATSIAFQLYSQQEFHTPIPKRTRAKAYAHASMSQEANIDEMDPPIQPSSAERAHIRAAARALHPQPGSAIDHTIQIMRKSVKNLKIEPREQTLAMLKRLANDSSMLGERLRRGMVCV